MSTPPPLPHEVLFKLCQEKTGNSAWAIEMTANEQGELVWTIYCDNKKKIKKVPKTFKGRPIKTVYCEKPTLLPE